MLVRHNTSLLEEAVAHVVRQAEIPTLQAEAAAFQARERAIAFRRLATGTAVALAAVGIGWGVHLLYPNFGSAANDIPKAEVSNLVIPTASSSSAAPRTEVAGESQVSAPPKTAVPSGPVGPVTVDYTKFQTQTVNQLGSTWIIETGHHYAKDTDTIWNHAWCYTKRSVSGAMLSVDLADRDGPRATPVALIASEETLRRAGLSDKDAIILATFCTWNDNAHFTFHDFKLSRAIAEAPPAASTFPSGVPAGAYVQFGSFSSSEEATAELQIAVEKWNSFLNGSRMFVQTVQFGTADVRYNLRAQFINFEDAKRVCSIITASAGECFAGKY